MFTQTAAAGAPSTVATASNYQDCINPQWVTLLSLLGMNVEYERCFGCELFTKHGREILDFLSGYCVHNIGHNHPYVIQALKNELDKCGPAMLQSHVPESAGEPARRLCQLTGGGLEKVYFGSSGSEGVEAAIKFARAYSGRALSNERCFLAGWLRPASRRHPRCAVRRYFGSGERRHAQTVCRFLCSMKCKPECIGLEASSRRTSLACGPTS
jgi:hypothetical protein